MKLLSACCGAVLLGMPVVLVDAAKADFAKKMYYDYRPMDERETQGHNCGEPFVLAALCSTQQTQTCMQRHAPLRCKGCTTLY